MVGQLTVLASGLQSQLYLAELTFSGCQWATIGKLAGTIPKFHRIKRAFQSHRNDMFLGGFGAVMFAPIR